MSECTENVYENSMHGDAMTQKPCGVCFSNLNCLEALYPRLVFGIVEYLFLGEDVNCVIP